MKHIALILVACIVTSSAIIISGPLGVQSVLTVQSAQGASFSQVKCTNSPVKIRACPHVNCPVLFAYPDNVPVFAASAVSGDTMAGSDQWYPIQDTLSGRQAYIHSALIKACSLQAWQTRPVIPAVSETAQQIYQRGLKLGNDPQAFSKVGDCQSVPQFFLADFDTPSNYDLGSRTDLLATIHNFAGSFSRDSAAVNHGFNVASVLSSIWSNPAVCDTSETPLECEYRLHKPSIVIISMETWWSGRSAKFYADDLRQIVKFWVDHGVVPILATKADDLEGDGSVNAAIAQIADEFDVPLWNFWLAVQTLPNHGIGADGFHLTFTRNFFDRPQNLWTGWSVRNLTALEALDTVWRGLTSPEMVSQ